MRTSSLALAAGLGVLLHAGAAGAYCRTSVCSMTDPTTGKMMQTTAAVCDPPQQTDCGIPLFWASRCIEYSVQENASKEVTFAQTEQVMKAAFATWAAAGCSGGTPQRAVPRLLALTYRATSECRHRR